MRASQRLVSAVLAATLTGALVTPAGQAVARSVSSVPTKGPGAASPLTGAAPAPIDPVVRTYAVSGVSKAGLRALGPTTAKRATSFAALSAPEPATGFAVAGVTWKGKAPSGLSLAMRTSTGGTWSAWTPMVYDAEHGPSPDSSEARHAVPGTDPFVVGDVDQVQLKATTSTGTAPQGLTMSVIDPGTSTADAAPPAPIKASGSSATAAKATAAKTPAATLMPEIYSRAEWGVDERLRGCCTEYGEVHAGFVHHTVNANDYTRAEVPAIIRGIFAYHTQSRGWRDIGYNFLIDRFGRIWEGRYGGITKPVVGAHTLDYNENSFAASAIGNYETAQPSAVMLDAYERLYAWKLSLHGVRATSRQNVAGTMFNAISGHRDAAQTACPGIHLYNKIPTIITKADAYQHVFVGRELNHSFVNTTVPDVLAVSRSTGQLSLARGTGAPGFDPRVVVSKDFTDRDEVVGVGDVTDDGINDVMARTTTSGATNIYSGIGNGQFMPAKRVNRTWATSDLFAGPGDVDGDGHNDVVARSSTSGSLLLYPGRGAGRFAAGHVVIEKFKGINALAAAGDFDGDGDQDLLARGAAGALRVYLGDGTGQFPTQAVIATGWSSKDLLTGGLDVTGDSFPDVVARNSTTKVSQIFANIDGARLSSPIASLKTPMSSMDLSSDLNGDREPDLVVVTPSGALTIVPARRQNWFSPVRPRPLVWPSMNRVFVVGDWNGDGFGDTMAREASTGKMWLYLGRAAGAPSARIGGWAGWKARTLLTPVGDFDGDGMPDLMGKDTDGHIYLYPGNGSKGFKAKLLVRSSLPAGAVIIGVGLWNSDGAPDVLVRTKAGVIQLYPGNGPGGLDDPRTIGHGFGPTRYNTLMAAGDVTADGQPDLVGRSANGDLWLIPGVKPTSAAPGGGFAARQFVSSGWSSFRLG